MGGKNGPEFFDDPGVFETYLANRRNPLSANETLEKPVLLELVGDVQRLRILDLGCGDAGIGREFLKQGGRAYVGIEGSRNMVRLARKMLGGTIGVVHRHRIENWSYPEREFDLVISRLALHYVEEVSGLFQRVYRTLVPNGRFIFSIEHPVITSSDRARQPGEVREDWIVDNYFETGERVTRWMGVEVIKYHRPVEDYFRGLGEAGFVVDSVRESRPQKALMADETTYQRRKRIPLMLFFAARRPSR